eukprot:gene4493-4853_t
MEVDDEDDDAVITAPTGFIPGGIQFNPGLETIPWKLILEEHDHHRIRTKRTEKGDEIHVIDFWMNKIVKSSKIDLTRQRGPQGWRIKEAVEMLATHLPTIGMALWGESRIEPEIAQKHQQSGGYLPHGARSLNTTITRTPILTTGLNHHLTEAGLLQSITTIIGASIIFLGDLAHQIRGSSGAKGGVGMTFKYVAEGISNGGKVNVLPMIKGLMDGIGFDVYNPEIARRWDEIVNTIWEAMAPEYPEVHSCLKALATAMRRKWPQGRKHWKEQTFTPIRVNNDSDSLDVRLVIERSIHSTRLEREGNVHPDSRAPPYLVFKFSAMVLLTTDTQGPAETLTWTEMGSLVNAFWPPLRYTINSYLIANLHPFNVMEVLYNDGQIWRQLGTESQPGEHLTFGSHKELFQWLTLGGRYLAAVGYVKEKVPTYETEGSQHRKIEGMMECELVLGQGVTELDIKGFLIRELRTEANTLIVTKGVLKEEKTIISLGIADNWQGLRQEWYRKWESRVKRMLDEAERDSKEEGKDIEILSVQITGTTIPEKCHPSGGNIQECLSRHKHEQFVLEAGSNNNCIGCGVYLNAISSCLRSQETWRCRESCEYIFCATCIIANLPPKDISQIRCKPMNQRVPEIWLSRKGTTIIAEQQGGDNAQHEETIATIKRISEEMKEFRIDYDC